MIKEFVVRKEHVAVEATLYVVENTSNFKTECVFSLIYEVLVERFKSFCDRSVKRDAELKRGAELDNTDEKIYPVNIFVFLKRSTKNFVNDAYPMLGENVNAMIEHNKEKSVLFIAMSLPDVLNKMSVAQKITLTKEDENKKDQGFVLGDSHLLEQIVNFVVQCDGFGNFIYAEAGKKEIEAGRTWEKNMLTVYKKTRKENATDKAWYNEAVVRLRLKKARSTLSFFALQTGNILNQYGKNINETLDAWQKTGIEESKKDDFTKAVALVEFISKTRDDVMEALLRDSR